VWLDKSSGTNLGYFWLATAKMCVRTWSTRVCPPYFQMCLSWKHEDPIAATTTTPEPMKESASMPKR